MTKIIITHKFANSSEIVAKLDSPVYVEERDLLATAYINSAAMLGDFIKMIKNNYHNEVEIRLVDILQGEK